MLLHDIQNDDTFGAWYLNAPEAQVLSATEERRLLLGLTDCRQRLVQATRRRDGSEWAPPIPDAEFQEVVRRLADSPIPADPETAAVRLVARRYQEIRTKLAMANVRLVAHVAKHYRDRGMPTADLLQEGITGLLLAIDRFNPVNPTRLATYAVWWIRQAIQRAVAAGAYPVRLNAKQVQRLARAQRAYAEAQNYLGVDVRPHGPEVTPSPLSRLDLAAIRPRVSLDAPCHTDDSTCLADLLVFSRSRDQGDEEVDERLGAMIRVLKPREHLVLKLRFGLDGESRHSLSQISKVLEVSKERIRQIQQRALEKLRTAASRHEQPPSISLRMEG